MAVTSPITLITSRPVKRAGGRTDSACLESEVLIECSACLETEVLIECSACLETEVLIEYFILFAVLA